MKKSIISVISFFFVFVLEIIFFPQPLFSAPVLDTYIPDETTFFNKSYSFSIPHNSFLSDYMTHLSITSSLPSWINSTQSYFRELCSINVGLYAVNFISDSLAEFGFVTDKDNFYVLDIVDKLNPTIVGQTSLQIGGQPREMVISGNFAYVLVTDDPNFALKIFDFSVKNNPVMRGVLNISKGSSGTMNHMDIKDNYVFVSFIGLRIIDVSDVDYPTEIQNLHSTSGIRDVCVRGNDLHLIYTNFYFIYDISVLPGAPTNLGFQMFSGGDFSYLYVNGDYSYLTRYSEIHVVSIIDRANPTATGGVISGVNSRIQYIEENYAYSSSHNNGGNFQIFDISDKVNPFVLYEEDVSLISIALCIHIHRNLAYISEYGGILRIFKLWDLQLNGIPPLSEVEYMIEVLATDYSGSISDTFNLTIECEIPWAGTLCDFCLVVHPFGNSCEKGLCLDDWSSDLCDYCNKTHPINGTCVKNLCITNWVGDNCNWCPNNFIEETGCIECSNYWMNNSAVCDFCPPQFNESSNCLNCSNNWFGINCEFCPTEYDNETSNCEDCADGMWGDNCDVFNCSGVPYYNLNVCNNHGECIGPEECVCGRGWRGLNCSLLPNHYCFGLSYDHVDVCNGVGNCTANNTCECQDLYYSKNCKVTTCSGIFSNSSIVCNSGGECIYFNNCNCSYGYQGDDCEVPPIFCDEILYTLPFVCHGRGECIRNNTCNCTIGFWGDFCQNKTLYNCYGNLSNTPQVCSGNGNCTDENTWYFLFFLININSQCNHLWNGSVCDVCMHNYDILQNCENCFTGYDIFTDCQECLNGYSGTNCNIFECYNFDSEDPTVCNENGDCFEPDTCVCDDHYIGNQCNTFVEFSCNSFLYNDPNVCSNHGECVDTNHCVCSTGFEGTWCDVPIKYCFDPDVCGNHGSCQSNDVCACEAGYGGFECTVFSCSGVLQTEPSVCSGVGNCDDIDTCICYLGFTGDECEVWQCDGFVYDSVFACTNGNGVCVGPDNCVCDPEHSGTWCESFSCFVDSLCSGNGDCIGPNTCDCYDDFYGAECELVDCFGTPNIVSGVCNDNGDCTLMDTCSCSYGWTSAQCDEPVCFGIAATNNSVCDGHGVCVGVDDCSCDLNWNGNMNCSSCSPNYEPPDCLNEFCDPVITCNNRGTCSNLDCFCDQHVAGQFCEICADSYFNYPNCDVFCKPDDSCNGNGECDIAGECSCFNNDVNGYFDGLTDCQYCLADVYGSECRSYVGLTFIFNSEFDGIILDIPESISYLSCGELVRDTDIPKVGSGCYGSRDLNNFVLYFGSNPTLTLTESIDVDVQKIINEVEGISESNEIFITINDATTVPPPTPTAVLTGPIDIGICEDLVVSGDESSSTDGRGLKFKFTFVDGSQEINNLFDIQFATIPQVSFTNIDKTHLSIGTNEIQLEVFNFWGETEITSLFVEKSFDNVPIAFIKGSNYKRTRINEPFSVEAGATQCGAKISDSVNYNFIWTCQQSIPFTVENDRKILFAADAFPGPGDYNCEFTVQVVSDPTIQTTESVLITVLSSPLVATITGGYYRVVSNLETITVDASESNDPDNLSVDEIYSWSCLIKDDLENILGICTDDLSIVGDQTTTFNIPAGTFNSGYYQISLTYAKGTRTSETFVMLEFVEGEIPNVFIFSHPPVINPQKVLVLGSSILYQNNPVQQSGNLGVDLKWYIDGEIIDAIDIFTPDTNDVIGFKANVFTPGSQFEIKIEARIGLVIGKSIALIVVNAPPAIGSFDVTPVFGGMQFLDTYSFSCINWQDVDLLAYAIYYVDPVSSEENLLVPFSDENRPQSIIPVFGTAVSVIARVKDVHGAISSTGSTVNVFENPFDINTFTPTFNRFITDSGEELTIQSCLSVAHNGQKYLDFYCEYLTEQQVLDFGQEVMDAYDICLLQEPINEMDEDTVKQLTYLISSIAKSFASILNSRRTTKQVNEFAYKSEQVLDLVDNVLSTNSNKLNDISIENIGSTLGNIMKILNENKEDIEDIEKFSEKILGSTNTIAVAGIRGMVVGEDQKQFKEDENPFAMLLKKVYRNKGEKIIIDVSNNEGNVGEISVKDSAFGSTIGIVGVSGIIMSKDPHFNAKTPDGEDVERLGSTVRIVFSDGEENVAPTTSFLVTFQRNPEKQEGKNANCAIYDPITSHYTPNDCTTMEREDFIECECVTSYIEGIDISVYLKKESLSPSNAGGLGAIIGVFIVFGFVLLFVIVFGIIGVLVIWWLKSREKKFQLEEFPDVEIEMKEKDIKKIVGKKDESKKGVEEQLKELIVVEEEEKQEKGLDKKVPESEEIQEEKENEQLKTEGKDDENEDSESSSDVSSDSESDENESETGMSNNSIVI